jgi:predicted metal-dependent phosphoesterase TrpH
MNKYLFDVHLHTHHSYDSLLTPRKLVRTARRAGFSSVFVTDHNTIRGGVAARKIVREDSIDLLVFVGAEIKTEHGDVIGFFLNEEIKSRNYHEVIDEIHAQDGIVYLPHPYARSTSLKDMDLNRVQVVEAYNGRQNMNQNRAALELAKSLNVPFLGGSDAHLQYEVGTVVNSTDVDITQEDALRRVIFGNTSSIHVRRMQPPLIPRFRMTQYMSWLRSGNSKRVLERVKLYLLRQTRFVAGLST